MNGKQSGNRPRSQGQCDGRPHGGPGKHNAGGNQPSLDKITAPYNFVPLSRKVFFPDWAGQVSHDIPFADGISGELVCELTTDTPIYVRNGGKWDHDAVMRNPEAQSFFYVKNGNERHFMIPGTTLKGMLRSVIEIASFGKMNRVDDHRYSIRDMQNRDLYLNRMKNVHAGWLRTDDTGEGWVIIPCSYALISHELLNNDDIKRAQTSLSKYKTWGWNRLDVKFTWKKGSVANRVTKLGEGEPGRLVFTGQPKENTGGKFDKKNEFVFFAAKKGDALAVSPEMQRNIQFLYSDPNTGKPYEEWAHWLGTLSKGEFVPVFYQKRGNDLDSFGFTRMYRLPYANSVRQAIAHTSQHHFDARPDLAETIFGFVNGSSAALKGRVAISPAVATHAEPASQIQTILGAPKPSFYPNYIEQPNPAAQYKTFMDADCRIRGWKRYPARQAKDVSIPDGVGEKVDTKLIPLKANARFTFRVKLHNLKPVELGAIAWALTWGNRPQLRHSLGMGKSMGFGVARISITKADVDWQQAMTAFEQLMDREVGGEWCRTAQMEQLLAMANPGINPQCGKLEHLQLKSRSGNQFVNAKKAKLTLLPHLPPTATLDPECLSPSPAAQPKPRTPPASKEDRQQVTSSSPPDPVDLARLAEKWGRKN